MKHKAKTFRNIICSLICLVMLSVNVLCLSPTVFVYADDAPALSNPVVQDNGIVAWDCVYFGNYPQTSDGNGGFLVEPVKWRVLKVEGNKAYLMADKLIDCMPFCETNDNSLRCLYEQSTIRCWLNGYDASENILGLDYTENNFIDKAFTAEEQDAIETTQVVNDESMEWAQYYDANHFDTYDKIFLITRKEVSTSAYKSYGFVTDAQEEDEEGFISDATARRIAYTTDYAAAGGSHGSQYAEYINTGGTKNSWNLRSPGEYPNYNGFIGDNGEYSDIQVDSNILSSPNHGTRPCLYLDLTKTDVYSYAGKVYAKEEASISGAANYVKKYGDPAFSLKLKQTGDGALSYSTSDPEVAVVDDNGYVTVTGLGTVTITAKSAETNSYLEASKNIKITVKKRDPEITAEDVTKSYGDSAFALGATAKTRLTYESDNTNVCTVSEEGIVTIKGTGTANITLTAEADAYTNSGVKVITLTVNPGKQTITTAKSTFTKTYGDASFALGAKAKTALSYKSSASGVATVSSAGKVTIKGAGTAVITITAKAGNYGAATKKVTVRVKPRKSVLSTVRSSVKKQAMLTWKKRPEATGYKVEYATGSGFTNKKTVTISSVKTLKTTLKSLKSGKKYYVRIRAYKKAGTEVLYGAYSNVKTIIIK